LGAITANNVATAGAALEVWTERIKHAAIDPKLSQQLLLELLGHIEEATRSLTATEAAVSGGPRQPTLLLEDQRAGRLKLFDDVPADRVPVERRSQHS